MRGLVFRGPGQIRVEDVPDPALPPHGLILRPGNVGVCGSDLKTWRSGNHRIKGSQILGHEIAGVVAETDDERFEVGQAVAVCPCAPCMECGYCQAGLQNLCGRRQCLGYQWPGAMADLMAVPAAILRADGVVPLPSALSPEVAAVAEPLHTVLNGQDRAQTRPGESVLILGLGPIGILHAAVARSRGASPVVGLEPQPERVLAAASVLGERHTMPMDQGWEARVDEMVGGRGWDVVVIATAASRAVETAIKVAAPLGRILAFAGPPRDSNAVSIDLGRLHYAQLDLRGSFGGTPAYFRSAVRWLSEGNIDLGQFVTHVYPLEAAEDAFAAVERGHGLKSVIRVA